MKRTEIEVKVTDAIIAALEKGVAPWQQPWTGADGRARSLSTKKPYRGINSPILEAAAIIGGYSTPWWGTFKQIKALGGSVRKGQTGTPVVFWKMLEVEETDGTTKTVSLMRYYTVFNADQAEGLTLPKTEKAEPREVSHAVQDVIDGYDNGPRVIYRRGDTAFYSPVADTVTLPEPNQFKDDSGLAATAFHELVHSTGHTGRLDRLEAGATFGCESYASEELVAEMGAAMLAATVGVELKIEDCAAYVAGWLDTLKNDRSMIIKAAQLSQKAVDLITAN